MLGDQPARAAAGEFLGKVEDGAGQTFFQSFLVLVLNAAPPGEHLVVVDGLVELHHGRPFEKTAGLRTPGAQVKG